MFRRRNDNEKVDVEHLNEIINIGSKLLKLTFILIILISVYSLTLLLKEWDIVNIFKSILRLISPLFIGIAVAWLLHPIVSFFQKKGMRRGLGVAIVYFFLIVFVYLILGSLIPILSEQINELVKTIPSVLDSVKTFINKTFDSLDKIGTFSSADIKIELFKKIEELGTNIAQGLPSFMVDSAKSFFSGLGNVLIGLIIGFYLLLSADNPKTSIINLLPVSSRDGIREIANQVNTLLRRFTKGALIDSLVVFILSSIGFWIAGLKAPLLFGFFCGITNVIPYAGPYIGGAPAVIVGFSQSPTTGIITLISVVIVQTLEGNLLQPLIMSRSTKVHPVTVMIGLLVFGYFFGIIGMVLSTPIIAVIKIIFGYFREKYHWFEGPNDCI